jgi:hypothetical protein
MVCGMNGYWVAGEQIPTKVHPSGKLLIRALPASAVEGLVEALEDVLAAARLVTGPHPPASPKADELLKKSRAALATFKTQTGRD